MMSAEGIAAAGAADMVGRQVGERGKEESQDSDWRTTSTAVWNPKGRLVPNPVGAARGWSVASVTLRRFVALILAGHSWISQGATGRHQLIAAPEKRCNTKSMGQSRLRIHSLHLDPHLARLDQSPADRTRWTPHRQSGSDWGSSRRQSLGRAGLWTSSRCRRGWSTSCRTGRSSSASAVQFVLRPSDRWLIPIRSWQRGTRQERRGAAGAHLARAGRLLAAHGRSDPEGAARGRPGRGGWTGRGRPAECSRDAGAAASAHRAARVRPVPCMADCRLLVVLSRGDADSHEAS